MFLKKILNKQYQFFYFITMSATKMWNCIYLNGHHRSVCVNVEVISLYQRIPNSENWNYRLLNDKSKHWIMLWRNQAQRNFSGDPNTWLIRLYNVHFHAIIWIVDKKSVNFEDTKSKLFCSVFGQPIYFDLNTSPVFRYTLHLHTQQEKVRYLGESGNHCQVLKSPM